jgi:hypothetical protein
MALAYFGGYLSLVPIFLVTLPSSYGFIAWADSPYAVAMMPVRWYFVWAAVMNTTLFYALVAIWAKLQEPLLKMARSRIKWLRPPPPRDYEPIGGTGGEPLPFKNGRATLRGKRNPGS